MTTTLSDTRPMPLGAHPAATQSLLARYRGILCDDWLTWATPHRMLRQLGEGGQGVVYLTERHGADDFKLMVALKIFSPEHHLSVAEYEADMRRIAHVTARVVLIQQDNLLDVHNFIEQDSVRIMEMEWIDGHDLRNLLTQRMLDQARDRLSPEQWRHLNDVIVTPGPEQPRLKPGIAIQVFRECLAGLGALHREGIVHGDVKPSNIMLKRTGNAKVIDIGSAVEPGGAPCRRLGTPAYAAPEVLEGAPGSPQSDLASLGYVLIEMLSGRPPCADATTRRELIEAKRRLGERLPRMLPEDVVRNDLLLNLCRVLTAPDPAHRFASAEAADLDRAGAADFHRQLVKMDLASEYQNDIRVWLERLGA